MIDHLSADDVLAVAPEQAEPRYLTTGHAHLRSFPIVSFIYSDLVEAGT
jgi:hypothetical protein